MTVPIINNGTAHGSLALAVGIFYATSPMFTATMPSLATYLTGLTISAAAASYMLINGTREINRDRAKESKLISMEA